MSDDKNKKQDKKQEETPTTIISGGTVILNSVGNVHHGSGTQVNIVVSRRSN